MRREDNQIGDMSDELVMITVAAAIVTAAGCCLEASW